MTDITLQNFEAELIQGSQQQPVLLDIWAPWCGPCRTLGPLLEKLEVAYEGRFKLVKVNSDDQPEIAGQLSQMFGVRSIPFCVLFAGGQPVDGFVGALPESQIREFLDKHVASEAALEAQAELEEAEELMEQGNDDAALEKLEAALAADPENVTARYDLVRLLVDQGHYPQAQALIDAVRSPLGLAPRLQAAELWVAAHQAAAGSPGLDALDAAIAADRRNFEARYQRAQCLWVQDSPTAAMDELLEILMRDKTWNQELARRCYVGILEFITKPAAAPATPETGKGKLELAGKAAIPAGDPVVDQYRRKLSMALF